MTHQQTTNDAQETALRKEFEKAAAAWRLARDTSNAVVEEERQLVISVKADLEAAKTIVEQLQRRLAEVDTPFSARRVAAQDAEHDCEMARYAAEYALCDYQGAYDSQWPRSGGHRGHGSGEYYSGMYRQGEGSHKR